MTGARALLPSVPAFVTLSRRFYQQQSNPREAAMKNPLDSLWGTVISGLVITFILYQIVKFALH